MSDIEKQVLLKAREYADVLGYFMNGEVDLETYHKAVMELLRAAVKMAE